MRQNEKALPLALISFLSLNRLCPKRAPEHIIIVQIKFPRNPLFLFVFVGDIALDFWMPQNSTIFYYFSRSSAPDHIIFGWDCPGPDYFLFF